MAHVQARNASRVLGFIALRESVLTWASRFGHTELASPAMLLQPLNSSVNPITHVIISLQYIVNLFFNIVITHLGLQNVTSISSS